ncbi:unnamed protein product [Paramecium sonneborni]|uniref:Uncharacterized protein n=1 Tax=Paramecium sonneborni TaxID=65129 RepID=A0A8S1QGA0_9CILI|nr:unnamed protein product [Paramecium sonneborni]
MKILPKWKKNLKFQQTCTKNQNQIIRKLRNLKCIQLINLIQERQSSQLEQFFCKLKNVLDQNIGIKDNQLSIKEQFNYEIQTTLEIDILIIKVFGAIKRKVNISNLLIIFSKKHIKFKLFTLKNIKKEFSIIIIMEIFQLMLLSDKTCFKNIIQDFCETLQVPSFDYEKDIKISTIEN